MYKGESNQEYQDSLCVCVCPYQLIFYTRKMLTGLWVDTTIWNFKTETLWKIDPKSHATFYE